MKTNMLVIAFILNTLLVVANTIHNGKIAYALPLSNITIDGNLKDWPRNLQRYAVEEVVGPKFINFEDFNASYRIGYNLKEQTILLAIEVTDDSFTDDDFFELYFNAAHMPFAPSVIMFSFDKEGIKMLKHSKEKDPIHQFIDKSNVMYKTKRKGNKRIFEASIFLGEYIAPNRTIGVDFLFVDSDKNEPGLRYINWGTGYGVLRKEYNAGQLGDVILLNDNTEFGSVEGKINFQENSKYSFPPEVKITSINDDKLYIYADVDSIGHYKAELPIGNYYVSSAFKMTDPFAGEGFDNQVRIDETEKIEFTITSNQNTIAETLQIPVYQRPTYLFREEGILHSYDEGQAPIVDNFINTFMEYYDIPGASVALIKEGKVVYYNAFGVRSDLTNQKLTESDLFQAASITKAVFAFIVNRLADRNIIDLDKPLYQYLPFENIAHNEGYRLITARIVLSHQSGLDNWPLGGPGGWKSDRKADLLFTPGTKYGYSGQAFEYLGRVVQKITNKDLDQLLHDEVLQPLGLTNIYLTGNDSIRMTQGFSAYPTYWPMPFEAGVAHSMLTEAKVFAQFVTALSNRKGLSKERYDDMFKRAVLTDAFPSPNNSYWNFGVGLGFFIEDTANGKAIMHGGSNYDFQCEFVLYTEKKMGFVIFTNSNTGHKLPDELSAFLMLGRK